MPDCAVVKTVLGRSLMIVSFVDKVHTFGNNIPSVRNMMHSEIEPNDTRY
jgi:hypothetical protein